MKTDKELLEVIKDSIQKYCDNRECSECELWRLCNYCDDCDSITLPDYIKKLNEGE